MSALARRQHVRWERHIARYTTVTEQVYRHQLRPILLEAAIAMDEIFRRHE